ncbi:hypothetical protein Tco_1112810 [Tanacetum coccineum]|uniref:Uncharacterized protein n=1 Tax=Tanacetum coccineum TaxID=301880 RepID=A0ABQ5IQC2_9ASTR
MPSSSSSTPPPNTTYTTSSSSPPSSPRHHSRTTTIDPPTSLSLSVCFRLLVFPSPLVGTCSLPDVVVHRICLFGRRGSLCLLLRPHAKVFVF